MKKIGLIGGLSWVSTAEYYKRLNEITQSLLGGVSSARIAMESVNRQEYVDAVIERSDEDSACLQVLKAVLSVERAGADFIVISCNDVHRFVPKISLQTSIPFLHIAEPTAVEINKFGLKTVGLIGVSKTMESDFYPNILKQYGIETIVPTFEERAYINEKIITELTQDNFTEDTRKGYLNVIENLANSGAEGIILGCTEIPLLISANQIPIPSFSTTELHCAAAVQRAISEHSDVT